MTTNNHTPIATGAAANAAIINAPIAQLDAAIGNIANLTTAVKTSTTVAINELDAQIGAAAASSGSIGVSIDTDGTLKVGAVDAAAVIADGVVTGAKLADKAFALPNLVWAPYNQVYGVGEDFDRLSRWPYTTNVSIITDASNPYGKPTLRLAAAGAQVGKSMYLHEIGLKIGDAFTAVWEAKATADSFQLFATWYDVGDSFISSASSTDTAFSGTQRITLSGTVPASAYRLQLWINRTGTTAVFDTYFAGVFAGTFPSSAQGPSAFDAGRIADHINIGRMPAPNLCADPFNLTTGPSAVHGTTWNGRDHFISSASLSIVSPDASNPFGKTLRLSTGSALGGRRVYMDEVGLQVGDYINARIVMKAASGAGWLNMAFFTSADAFITSVISGGAVAFTNALQIFEIHDVTIPATAAIIDVAMYRESGSANIDIYSISLCQGALPAIGTPSVDNAYWFEEITDARGAFDTLEERLDSIALAEGFATILDVYGVHLLRSWQAKRAIIAASGTAQANILFIGDSWVYGVADWMRFKLQALYSAAGAGFQQFEDLDTYGFGGATWTRTGTWAVVDSTDGAWGPGVQHSTSTDTATPGAFSLTVTATELTIHYVKQATGGTFRYQVDSDGWHTIDTANATTAYATVNITGLAASSHTLVIEVTGAGTAGVSLCGVDCRLTANGVRVNYCGNGGASSLSFSQVDNTIWSAAITALNPDVVAILLGTNDMSGNVVPATFASNINTVIDRIQAALPLADILIITPADNGLEGRTYTVAEYVTELRKLAATQSVSLVDTLMNIGTYASGDARGMYANTSHPSGAGYALIAQVIIDRLQLQP